MNNTEIKNGQVFINNKPFSEWGTKEFSMWRNNTSELLNQCNRIYNKILIVAQRQSWK